MGARRLEREFVCVDGWADDSHVCCSVLQCAAVCCSMLWRVVVCCSVLLRAAVCCSVLQCAVEWVGG